LLLCPIPLALFIPSQIISGIFVGIGLGFFGIIVASFHHNNGKDVAAYYGGWSLLAEWVWEATTEYYKFTTRLIEDINKARVEPLPLGQEKLDIKIVVMFVGLLFSTLGLIVVVPLWAFISTLKCIPALFRGYYLMWYMYIYENNSSDGLAWKCVCFPTFLVTNALYPVLGVLTLVFSYLYAIMGGLATGVVYYKNGAKEAFIYMFASVNAVDIELTKGIFGPCIGDYKGFLGCCCNSLVGHSINF